MSGTSSIGMTIVYILEALIVMGDGMRRYEKRGRKREGRKDV